MPDRIAQSTLPCLLLLLTTSACGPSVSDRRLEKASFPGGVVLVNESHIQTDSLCLRHCAPVRISKLTLEVPGQGATLVAEIRPYGNVDCCLFESAKPVFARSRDQQIIGFGSYVFSKQDPAPYGPATWIQWSQQQDQETNYFLRNFPCKTSFAPFNGPPPCDLQIKSPYANLAIDADARLIRFSRNPADQAWPKTLVYSAQADSVNGKTIIGNWQFDFERTLQENPGLQYNRFPADVRLEVRDFRSNGDVSGGMLSTPEAFLRNFPSAIVVSQRTIPLSASAWTAVPGDAGQSAYPSDFRAAYGDPDPDLMTIYSQVHQTPVGHEAHLLRIGQWLPPTVYGGGSARFVRLVRP